MRKPDFFIVGAPKCGTTAMNEYLKQHPEIFIPEKKEAHFFGTDLHSYHYIRDEKEYLSLFSQAKYEKRVGESSVWYLYSKRAAYEIKDFCSSASIIIMLRSPIDMLYALHSQHLYDCYEDIEDFEAALAAEEDRKRGKRIPANAGKEFSVELLFYREIAKFSEQVQRYLDVFGQDNVHIIIYDDFKQNTVNVYKKTLRFLGVNEEFLPEFRIVNPNKRIRSRILQRFLMNPPWFFQKLREYTRPYRPRLGLMGLLWRLNVKNEPRPPMNPELRKRLQAEFLPEIERLSLLLGRDLTHWCRDRTGE